MGEYCMNKLRITMGILLCTMFFAVSVFAGVKVNHSNPLLPYHTVYSPDGRHFAVSGEWYVRIWDISGNMTGEYFDRFPRISFRKDFRFWNIHRSKGSVIAFLNNKELAIVHNGQGDVRKVVIVGLNGHAVREIDIPGKKINEMGTHEDNRQGRRSEISKVFVSPDGQRIITVEPHGGYFFIRDRDFKELKGIRLEGTNSYSDRFAQIKDLLFLPDNSGFIIKTTGHPVSGGWISWMTLFNMHGVQVKGLLTDQWISSIETSHGKVARDRDNGPPDNWDMSPDGRYISWLGCTGKIDRGSLGTYRVEQHHPAGSFREKPYSVAYCIRKLEISSGKQYQAYVLKGGDETLQNRIERWPITEPYITALFFTKNSREYIGMSAKGLYRISFDGKITSYRENPEDREFSRYYKARYGKEHKKPLELEDAVLTPDRETVISRNYYILNHDGTLKGHVRPFLPVLNTSTEGSRIEVSRDGRYISIEKDRGSDSVLWDTKNGVVTREKASIYWDNRNREYRLSADHSTIKIKYEGSEIVLPIRRHIKSVFPFPNREVGVLDNGLVLLDSEGNARIKHPKSTYSYYFAMHPGLKYYMVPNVDPKIKKMVKVSITGQRISDFWIGSFISTVKFSPDGSLLIGSHDESGCISIWDDNNKLQDYPGHRNGRLFDLHPEPILGLAMTGNNRFLVTGTPDGIVVTDLKTGKRARASLYFRNNESNSREFGYVVSDSTGRFECSDEEKDRVSIMEDGKAVTRALWNRYYTENLLWKFMQGE